MSNRLIQVTVPLLEVDRVKDVLKHLPDVHGLNCFRGDESALIIFRARQKKTGAILQLLDKLGVGNNASDDIVVSGDGVDDLNNLQSSSSVGGSIDILNLQVTKPRLANNAIKKPRAYRIDDRMTIEEIYEVVDGGVHMTFDFIALTTIAAFIASVGMLSNSSVVVVASMLLSPLMGPVLGVTLGFLINDKILLKKSLRTEAVGLVITFLVGTVLGLLSSGFSRTATVEMVSRGTPESLVWGLIVAIPSGAALAISVTMGGVNSLVGTAIAATLLPPIANAGINIVWGLQFAVIEGAYGTNAAIHFSYCFFSVVLFIINFIVIFAVACIVFKMKKVHAWTKFNLDESPTRKMSSASAELTAYQTSFVNRDSVSAGEMQA